MKNKMYIKEEIVCPNCESTQIATIEKLCPFDSRVHNCKVCNYVIMESEWETTDIKKQFNNR